MNGSLQRRRFHQRSTIFSQTSAANFDPAGHGKTERRVSPFVRNGSVLVGLRVDLLPSVSPWLDEAEPGFQHLNHTVQTTAEVKPSVCSQTTVQGDG